MSGDNWRDARLKKALDSAPDDAARPADSVREAILHKARLSAGAATAPARAKPQRVPWWQGLATVGAVAFMGVMFWTGKTPPLIEPTPAPVPAASEAPAEAAPAAEVAPPPPAPDARADAAAKAQRMAEARQQSQAQMKQERRAASEREQAEAKARSAQAERAPPVAPMAPPPEMVVQAPHPPPPPPPPVMMAPPAPAPAPVARPAPPAAAAIPLPSPSWTAVRVIGADGQPALLKREQLPPDAVDRLSALLALKQVDARQPYPLSRSPLASRFAPAPPLLRLELLNGEELVGLLELGEDTPTAQALRRAQTSAAPASGASR